MIDTKEKLLALDQILQIIAAPRRADGSYNRDREACRLLAEEALRILNEIKLMEVEVKNESGCGGCVYCSVGDRCS